MSQTLHQELVQLRGRARLWVETGDCEQFLPCCGICANLGLLSGADSDLLDDLLDRWPGSTGDSLFQVPHPVKTPEDAFLFTEPDEKWNPQSEYARNRLALLDWLIEQTAPTVQLGEKA